MSSEKSKIGPNNSKSPHFPMKLTLNIWYRYRYIDITHTHLCMSLEVFLHLASILKNCLEIYVYIYIWFFFLFCIYNEIIWGIDTHTPHAPICNIQCILYICMHIHKCTCMYLQEILRVLHNQFSETWWVFLGTIVPSLLLSEYKWRGVKQQKWIKLLNLWSSFLIL